MMNYIIIYRCTGGAIGRPDALTLEMAELGPRRTCFCCARWTSSIWARSTSKNTGANKIADELNKSHVAEHENVYKPEIELKILSQTPHINQPMISK